MSQPPPLPASRAARGAATVWLFWAVASGVFLGWFAGTVGLVWHGVAQVPVLAYLLSWTYRHAADLVDPVSGGPLLGLGVANRLSISRLVLVPTPAIAVFLVPEASLEQRVAVLVVCGGIFVTDGLDGLCARRLGQVSRFGAFLDPSADFFLLLMLATALAASGIVPWWFAAAVILRIMLVLVGAVVVLGRGVPRTRLTSLRYGRPAVALALVAMFYALFVWTFDLTGTALALVDGVCFLAVVFAVASVVEKLRLFHRLRRELTVDPTPPGAGDSTPGSVRCSRCSGCSGPTSAPAADAGWFQNGTLRVPLWAPRRVPRVWRSCSVHRIGRGQAWPDSCQWIVGMSLPRCIEPGSTYFVTRRCHERRFSLVPQKWVTALLTFLLAFAAKCYGVEIHAACALSNHYHLVLTDVAGRLPDFLRTFNSLATRALNAKRGGFDSIWSSRGPTVSLLCDAGAVVDKIVYTLANACAAGLVRKGRDWPGLRTTPESYLAPAQEIERPGFFFRQDRRGKMAKRVGFKVTVPPTHAGTMTPREFRDLIAEELRECQDAHAARLAARGHRYPSVAVLKAANPRTRATRPERRGPGAGPHCVIARDAVSRAAAEEHLRGFRRAYRAAREAYCSGMRNVVWPFGTWKMVQLHGCPVATPPRVVRAAPP